MINIIRRGLKVGLQTSWTLGKIIFPITLVITILSETVLMDWLVKAISPAIGLIGLSGEAAIPLVIGNMLNLYAAIGAILTLDLTVKEVFLLAVMLSFSHNLFVESAVAKTIGLKIWIVVSVRISLALLSAWVIHLSWQGGEEIAQYGFVSSSAEAEISGYGALFIHGFETALVGILQLAAVVIPLMVFVQMMKELNWLRFVAKAMIPLTKLLRIAPNTSTTLASGLTLGLAFGAGVMIQAVKDDGVKKKDLYLVFIFLVACHAVIEDTLIFIPLGIPVWPLLLIRIGTAIILTIAIALIWDRIDQNKVEEEEIYAKEA